MAPLFPLMNWLMRHVMVVITATSTAISFFALIVLYRQNLTAHAAADAANENAKATRASVDGYIKSQRAWIKVM